MRLKPYFRALLVIAAALAAFPAAANPSILIDVGTGKVLRHEEAFRRWHPASLTKLMTAYVAFKAVEAGELAFDSPIRVTPHAASQPPSKMGYPVGSLLTLDNAIKIIMVKSANDIATAIGENVGGSEKAFAARMNAAAKRLGMTGTHFVNANGLHDEQQYTTARDLALLVRALRTEFAEHAHYFDIEAIRAGDSLMRNYNTLIGRFDGADGMKTGFICPSGFNLIGSATRGGRTLAAVVLGSESPQDRAAKAADMLALGFQSGGQAGTPLAALEPYGERGVATDMRPEICTPEARADRRGERDDDGRLVIDSVHVHEFVGEPEVVAVGLGGATGPQPQNMPPNYADVPIPTPRPDYPFPAEGEAAAGVDSAKVE